MYTNEKNQHDQFLVISLHEFLSRLRIYIVHRIYERLYSFKLHNCVISNFCDII